jgi:EKC/KEOPS complex subunit PCC1/LAGE3
VLKQDQSRIEYSISNNDINSILHIKVFGIDDRIVRVTVNNLLENLKTVIECFEEFDTI